MPLLVYAKNTDEGVQVYDLALNQNSPARENVTTFDHVLEPAEPPIFKAMSPQLDTLLAISKRQVLVFEVSENKRMLETAVLDEAGVEGIHLLENQLRIKTDNVPNGF